MVYFRLFELDDTLGVDLVGLFQGLSIRHVVSPDTDTLTVNCEKVAELKLLIEDKIKADNKAMDTIKSTKWLELNRSLMANKIARLVNLLDVLTLANGAAANQVQANGVIISDLMDKILNDKPLEKGLPVSILNFINDGYSSRIKLLRA